MHNGTRRLPETAEQWAETTLRISSLLGMVIGIAGIGFTMYASLYTVTVVLAAVTAWFGWVATHIDEVLPNGN